MVLDAAEIVMRAEEFYSTTFADDEAAQIQTVGEFFSLICSKLNVVPLEKPQTAAILPKSLALSRISVSIRSLR